MTGEMTKGTVTPTSTPTLGATWDTGSPREAERTVVGCVTRLFAAAWTAAPALVAALVGVDPPPMGTMSCVLTPTLPPVI